MTCELFNHLSPISFSTTIYKVDFSIVICKAIELLKLEMRSIE